MFVIKKKLNPFQNCLTTRTGYRHWVHKNETSSPGAGYPMATIERIHGIKTAQTHQNLDLIKDAPEDLGTRSKKHLQNCKKISESHTTQNTPVSLTLLRIPSSACPSVH